MNVVVLRGHLSTEPVYRTLSSGTTMCSLEVTCPTDDGSASVPVAWFDAPPALGWQPGTEVVVAGVVRRRFFRSGGATATRTEVVASDVCEARRRKAVERLIASQAEQLSRACSR